MIDLREQDWKIIKAILSKYPYTFYVFGSRTKKKARRFSDLDLCYKENIPDGVLARIVGEFEESDLPFKVDILNWNNCTPEFQKQIESSLVKLFLS